MDGGRLERIPLFRVSHILGNKTRTLPEDMGFIRYMSKYLYVFSFIYYVRSVKENEIREGPTFSGRGISSDNYHISWRVLAEYVRVTFLGYSEVICDECVCCLPSDFRKVSISQRDQFDGCWIFHTGSDHSGKPL